MGRLDGKVAVITGAGTGIGRAGALAMAEEGAAVVLSGPDDGPLRDAAERLTDAGYRAAWTQCDVARPSEVEAMVRFTIDAFGGLNILYNNAGIAGSGLVEEIDEAFWDRVLAVNLKGAFLTAKAAIPAMRRAGGGVIINTSSVLAFATIRRQAAYAASKAGIVGLTKALAIDHADDRIRVLAIVPGSVDTAMMWGDATPQQRAEWEELIRREHVLRRVAEPVEIGRVVAFLASDEASFMTGSCVVIDGGTLSKWAGLI